MPIENVYLIGHSLGAHIVGYTARFFKQSTKSQLLRITGLDPANPCFNGNKGDNRTLPGIRHGDAAFVDIIHTNPGAFGEPNPIGNADFYVGGFLPIQSGCLLLGCSHTRAIIYFIESVFPTYGRNFLAAYCPFANIKKNDCDGPYEHTMGITTPNNLNGTYFLKVNSKPPFGKNIKYYKDVKKQCSIC
ncbi:vitellogenin-1-like isoform 1-T2 [Cochliomyia hominivorax]